MKKIMIALLFILPLFSLAQKVELKDTKITVDGKNCAIMERSLYQGTLKFEVKDTSGKLVLVIMYKSYIDGAAKSASNPSGEVGYYEYTFLESKKKAETEQGFVRVGKEADLLVKQKLFKDGLLDQEAVGNFVLVNGTSFSDRARRL